MKKNLGSAGELFTQSVFIVASYDEEGTPNAMNVAWGGEKRFIGEIVNTRVDEAILDDEGRVDFAKFQPIVYDSTHRIYRVVGDVVGGAWDAGKPLM